MIFTIAAAQEIRVAIIDGGEHFGALIAEDHIAAADPIIVRRELAVYICTADLNRGIGNASVVIVHKLDSNGNGLIDLGWIRIVMGNGEGSGESLNHSCCS